MTRRVIVALVAVALTGWLMPVYAAPLAYEWKRNVGVSLADVATDDAGSTVVTGEVTAGDFTAFLVVAFGADGTELWRDTWKPLRDPSGTAGQSISIGRDGQIYSLGFGWHCRFGCESGGWFIRAYSPEGALRWTRQAAGWRTRPRQSKATGIDTWSGGVVIAGFEYDDYVGPTVSWIRAYGYDGTLAWKSRVAVTAHADQRVTAEDVAAGSSGSVYVAGSVEPDVPFGNQHDQEAFVARLDANGEPRWARVFTERGDSDGDSAFSVDVRGATLAVGGVLGDPIGWHIRPPHLGWLARLSLAGDVRWMRSWGSEHPQDVEDVVLASMGDVVTVGGLRTADRSYALTVRTYTGTGDLSASRVIDPVDGSLVGKALAVGGGGASLVGTRYGNAYLSPGIGGRLWRLAEGA